MAWNNNLACKLAVSLAMMISMVQRLLCSTDHNRYQYRPRPGIVLDDTLDYTGPQQMPTQRPFVTPPNYQHHGGETFDVVVSASHGPGSGG